MKKLGLLLLLLCGCPSGGGPPADMGADLSCPGDLSGTPRQVCGYPDASFSPMYCACIGDA